MRLIYFVSLQGNNTFLAECPNPIQGWTACFIQVNIARVVTYCGLVVNFFFIKIVRIGVAKYDLVHNLETTFVLCKHV